MRMASAGDAADAVTEHVIETEDDVVFFRHAVRAAAVAAGFGILDQTKVVTAASELARNAVEYGGGGRGRVGPALTDGRRGIHLVIEDDGPGIDDLELALAAGYTGGNGLGMGLPGARRLVDVFELRSEPGVGTRLTIEKWLR